jgi:hypothetical protein
MKKIFAVLIFIFAISALAYAQQNAQNPIQQQQKAIILKPVFLGSDLLFAFNALNGIEVQGNEVDNFLACKNLIKDALQKAGDAKKNVNDSITVDIPLATAQVLATFLERAKFSGDKAEQYKHFMEALIEAVKPYKTQNK